MYAVEMIDATKIISNNVILNQINLQLFSNKIYGFWGRNSSGKSMLFKAISGLITLSSGQVKVFGKSVGLDMDYPDSLGVIIEKANLWNEYTGFENLKLLSSIKKLATDDLIKLTMTRVGLDYDDKRKYKSYSLGMKQKLALAQAIMEHPKLIILDEPTSALDEESCQNIRKVFVEEKLRGATILIASHNKEDIFTLCDSIYKIDAGVVTPWGAQDD